MSKRILRVGEIERVGGGFFEFAFSWEQSGHRLVEMFWASLLAIGLLFTGSDAAAEYPVTVKSVLSRMTASVQKALENRISRLEIELPPAVDWGVEIKKVSGSNMNSQASTGSLEKTKKSNREAARLFIEMFSVLSSTTVVMFPTEIEAEEARNSWASSFRGLVTSLDTPSKSAKGYSKLRSRRFTAEEQEAVLLGSDGVYVPDGTEVLILAGARIKDFKKIERMSERQGQETAILMLNGRHDAVKASSTTPSEGASSYEQNFINVFNYCSPVIPKEINRELLLFHEFNGKWMLGEKTARTGLVGAVKSLTESPFSTIAEWEKTKPTTDDILSQLK